jgi:hypothetical protein
MKSEAPENKVSHGPSVFRFKARLFRYHETAKPDSWIRLTIPEQISRNFPSHGMTKVDGTMNGHPFRAVLEPNTSGSHWLRVSKALSEGAGAGAGDRVQLVILGPEPEPAVPADFRTALSASRGAKMLWKDLTPVGRRDWIRWIESAKRPETRARRITRAIEQLSSGKRHPCCMNIHEFMLCRIQKNQRKT